MTLKIKDREGWTYFDRLLAEHGRRKVGNSTYAERRWDEGGQRLLYVITLYETPIIVLDRTHGAVTLDSGGHRTLLTKRRMNEFLEQFDLQVAALGGEWYVRDLGTSVDDQQFVDGMVVDL